jgi:hypothetical protein
LITVTIFSNYRPRSFLHHQFDQVPVPTNVYDPQGYNSMLPELSILARYMLIYCKCFYLGKLKRFPLYLRSSFFSIVGLLNLQIIINNLTKSGPHRTPYYLDLQCLLGPNYTFMSSIFSMKTSYIPC